MFALIASLLWAQAAAAQAPLPAACSAGEFSAFDFWVGEWDVYPAGGEEQIARSSIRKASAGCAIQETWMPLQGGGGTSLTTLDPDTGTWHQLWIGQSPGRVFFEGGMVDRSMVLTGYWGKNRDGDPQLVRMTYSPLEDGTVRQYGQASADHGRTWSDSFDLIYRPRAD